MHQPQHPKDMTEQPMNILIIQENGRHDANRAFRECYSLQRAFSKLGHQAEVWGLGHANFKTKMDFNSYDIIFNLENYDDSGWLPNLATIKAYKVLWAIDEHCKGVEYYRYLAGRDKVSLVLHSTMDYVLEEPGHRWFPNCYDDSLLDKRDVAVRAEVGFCGNIINRGERLDILAKHFALIKDVFVIGESMVKAINSYKVHFNANMSCDVNYRSFETLGCGVVLATNYNHQYDHLGFVDMVNSIVYRSNDEMVSKIRAVLGDEVLRKKIAETGYEFAKRHTYNARIAELCATMGW